MKFKEFEVERKGDAYSIVHKGHQWMSLIVDISNGMAELKEINVSPECKASEIIEVLKDVELFIKNLDI